MLASSGAWLVLGVDGGGYMSQQRALLQCEAGESRYVGHLGTERRLEAAAEQEYTYTYTKDRVVQGSSSFLLIEPTAAVDYDSQVHANGIWKRTQQGRGGSRGKGMSTAEARDLGGQGRDGLKRDGRDGMMENGRRRAKQMNVIVCCW